MYDMLIQLGYPSALIRIHTEMRESSGACWDAWLDDRARREDGPMMLCTIGLRAMSECDDEFIPECTVLRRLVLLKYLRRCDET